MRAIVRFGVFFSLLFSVTDLLAAQLHRRNILTQYQIPKDGKIRVAFIDADQTLRVSRRSGYAPNDPKDVLLIPRVGHTIAQLNKRGYFVAVVSNQGGIGKHLTLEQADAALLQTIRYVAAEGGKVHYFDFADKHDQNRKPEIGMALRLQQKLKAKFGSHVSIDRSRSFMVGDAAYSKSDTRPDGRLGFNFSNSDRHFAINAGIGFYEPQYFFGWIRYGFETIRMPDDVVRYLKALKDKQLHKSAR